MDEMLSREVKALIDDLTTEQLKYLINNVINTTQRRKLTATIVARDAYSKYGGVSGWKKSVVVEAFRQVAARVLYEKFENPANPLEHARALQRYYDRKFGKGKHK